MGARTSWARTYVAVLTKLLAQMVKPAMRETGFNPWLGKIPWRRRWQPTPVLMPGKFHGWRSLVGYSPWGCKELDTTERLHFTKLRGSIYQEGNPMDRGAWWATVHGVAKESDTTWQVNNNNSKFIHRLYLKFLSELTHSTSQQLYLITNMIILGMR